MLYQHLRSKFQFQSGPIKASKPVRIYQDIGKFQFQSGPIKAAKEVFSIVKESMFQFQSGPIKAYTKTRLQPR